MHPGCAPNRCRQESHRHNGGEERPAHCQQRPKRHLQQQTADRTRFLLDQYWVVPGDSAVHREPEGDDEVSAEEIMRDWFFDDDTEANIWENVQEHMDASHTLDHVTGDASLPNKSSTALAFDCLCSPMPAYFTHELQTI